MNKGNLSIWHKKWKAKTGLAEAKNFSWVSHMSVRVPDT